MRAALYLRVSTQEQIENYSIESQRERLEAYCKSKGWSVGEIFIDGGYSGANMERPALQQMLNTLDRFDAVVVYRLDRLSRSQRDTLTLIEDYFLKNNVDFVSITETLDTSTPFGKAMIGILSVFAQLERETIAERMRMGHIKRAEEGLRGMGGDYDPAGYNRQEGKLVVNDQEAKHVKLAFDLYEQYHSISRFQKVIKKMGLQVWRFRRYRDMLSNKLYCGYVSFAGEYYRGQHDPIITEEQFDRVQMLLSRHRGRNAYKAKESLFSGMVVCGCCGESYMSYHTVNKKTNTTYRYYICRAKRFPAEYSKKCLNKTWRVEKIEKLIINELKLLTVSKRINNESEPKINYDKLIQKSDEKINRILGLYADGAIDKTALDRQLKSLNDEKEHLVKNKLMVEKQKETILTTDKLEKYVIDLGNVDFEAKQAIIQKLIQKIVIKGESISIEWIF
ncbi:recombinase family protein [Paenibacillus sp. IITD108]|uniref:recombinase family protein n=1 Tax=Paenibacillus sp. IITD108 TaxID=3116649 RepID=UPI002F416F9A